MIRPGDVMEIDGTRYRLWRRPSRNSANVQSTRNGFYTAERPRKSTRIVARPLNDTGQMLNVASTTTGDRIRDLADRSASRNRLTGPARPLQDSPPADADLRRALPDARRHGDRLAGLRPGDRDRRGTDGFFYIPDRLRSCRQRHRIVIMFTPEGRVEAVRLTEKRWFVDALERSTTYTTPVTDRTFTCLWAAARTHRRRNSTWIKTLNTGSYPATDVQKSRVQGNQSTGCWARAAGS